MESAAWDMVWWLVIISLFVLSMAGLMYPVIPSILLIWAGFAIYQFAVAPVLPTSFWVVMAVFTLLVFVADYVSNLYFVRKYGGSKVSQWAAVGGLIVGPFLMGPVGLIVAPFLAVTLVELTRQQDPGQAVRVAVGTLLGFVSSTLFKLVVQLIMIGWFLWLVLV
ncbi:protein of unknown function DUF456 [Caldalkalibacillus thermarum TA2.A1]|uniref:DUF456 domain-containing protein n=1 Tax=Caldalkalibacillus thermarum (strain TA2.A1) TaxID=986075 RepID=F5L4I3_CALTT|nr:DUF456 domain-containing protein [Caldalkalibacillus thermarum]EGL83763.1 protein of unknown function DUF456 [Caldalkalibacillus thermarum TA2.A1]QZT33873.1 DUF456 domain-containing protein [Caldalkalibacillus thermarum TA2.A1]